MHPQVRDGVEGPRGMQREVEARPRRRAVLQIEAQRCPTAGRTPATARRLTAQNPYLWPPTKMVKA